MSGWNARISLRNLRHSPSTTHGDVREATLKVWQVTPETSRDATCLVTWTIEALDLGRGATARTRRARSSSAESVVPTPAGLASNGPATGLGSTPLRLACMC